MPDQMDRTPPLPSSNQDARRGLLSRITALFALALFQRTTRLLVQAAWLFGAGFLIGWSLQVGWQAMPKVQHWIALGALMAAPPLLGLFIPVRLRSLLWTLDRRLGLQEQASAAWQAARRKESTAIPTLLYTETADQVQAATGRMLLRGWYLGRDLLSCLMVAVLLGTLGYVQALNAPLTLEPPSVNLLNQLPPLPDDPSCEPGSTGEKQPGEGDESSAFNLSDPAGLQKLLDTLGETLAQQAETQAVGAALQQGDMAQAAQEFEALADMQSLLSEEARQNLQTALQATANEAIAVGETQFAEDLALAAEALAKDETGDLPPSTTEAADALDAVAADLRDLHGEYADAGALPPGAEAKEGAASDPGPGSGSKQASTEPSAGVPDIGAVEPFNRIEGGTETFELAASEFPEGLEAPQAGSPGEETLPEGGSGSTVTAGSAVEQSTALMLYYQFSWKWRHVIAQYFSPEN